MGPGAGPDAGAGGALLGGTSPGLLGLRGAASPGFPGPLRGTRLQLVERAQILRKAVGLAERHLAAGTMLSWAPLGRCRSLLPLGGRVCAGLSARPYVVARHEVMLQPMRLPAHRRESCARRLRAPTRMRPLHSDRFLMDYFPRPLEGGPRLLPYARRPPRAPAHRVPLATPQRSCPTGAGSGTQGAVCLEHGVPSCTRCRSLGCGISRCCRAGHEGHAGSLGGPSCPIGPPRVAPGRHVLVPEARRAEAAALYSWPGRARPASRALSGSDPPATRRCNAPPSVLGIRPSSALGPDVPRPAKRQAPNRANWGDPGGGGWANSQRVGGQQTPYHPSQRGGATTRGWSPHPPPPARGPRGRQRVGGAADALSPQQAGGGGGDGPRPAPSSSSASAGATGAPPAQRDSPPPPSRATPSVAPRSFQPHLSGPESPRSAAATTPPAGSTAASAKGHQVSSGHATHPPTPPTSDERRSRGGLLLCPNGGRALNAAAIRVHAAATAAARHGRHRRDLVPSGTSLPAAMQVQAGGL